MGISRPPDSTGPVEAAEQAGLLPGLRQAAGTARFATQFSIY